MRSNKERLRVLMESLDLTFFPAEQVTREGWYVWRNNHNWPIHEYTIMEFSEGEFNEPVPSDRIGQFFEMKWNKAYGELAGPILGR